MPTGEAWAKARWLDVGLGERLPVLFDPPEVCALALPRLGCFDTSSGDDAISNGVMPPAGVDARSVPVPRGVVGERGSTSSASSSSAATDPGLAAAAAAAAVAVAAEAVAVAVQLAAVVVVSGPLAGAPA